MESIPRPLVEKLSPRGRAESNIRRWIQVGELRQGEALPSENVLAQRLQVARGTVRAALKRLQDEGFIDCTQGRIRRVAEKDGLKLDHGLMRRTVLLLAPSLDRDPRHPQSGWPEWLTQGAMHALRALGLHVLTLNPADLTAEEIEPLLMQSPFGVVVPEVFRRLQADPAAGLPVLKRMREAGLPSVAYGGDPRLEPFDRVTSDHALGSYRLTQHLLEQGRRRPMMLIEKPGTSYWLQARIAGYERAMREAGLNPLPPLVMPAFPAEREPDGEFFESVSRYVAGYLLEVMAGNKPIDAILSMSDGKTYPITRACQLLGRRVHDDVAVVGYDNYWADSWERQFIDAKPLATVDKKNFEMGQEMIRLLVARAEGKLPDAPQTRVVEPKLVANTDALLSSLS